LDTQKNTPTHEDLVKSLIDISVESWRFTRLFARLLGKMDAGDGTRYANQLRYFIKKIEDSLGIANIRLVNIEGQLYEPGSAATALNIGDFAPADRLLVDQMIEPIIMGPDGLIRMGTVMLRKAEL
jgi:hypothetical protein